MASSRNSDTSSSSSGSKDDYNGPKSAPRGRIQSENTNVASEERLLKASMDGDHNTVLGLLKEGISTEIFCKWPGQEGLRPLHLASWSGKDKVVRILLYYQAKRKAVGQGMTAVHFAAKGGHVGVLSVLWDSECNIKSRTAEGRSPLHLAAYNGNIAAVKWLVEKGSYINTKDVKGNTAEDLAKNSGYKEVALYLQEKAEELRMDGIRGERKLGEGAFGEVFLVKKNNDKSFVLKKINLADLERKKQEYAHQEIKLLKCLTHPYIVSCLGGGFKGRHLYIKMEYCSGGDLYSRIMDQRDKKVSFEENLIVSWSLRICLALKYIHRRNILHRDVKPHNIFLTGNGVIKLGDFGLSKVLEDNSVANTSLGSPAYMSPEIINGQPYDSGADMWAFGCVMFEMAALRLAFPYKNLKLPGCYSKAYADAIELLLHDALESRPRADDLLNLPIFHEALENQLLEKEHQVTELNQEVDDLCLEIEDLTNEAKKQEDVINKMKACSINHPDINTPKVITKD